MIILTSNSPRRKELLSKITTNFICVNSNFEEKDVKYKSPRNIVYYKGLNKGIGISKERKDDYIICGDTIVVYNKKIYGKPVDKIEAYNYLSTLQNKVHKVYSMYFILHSGKIIKKNLSINKVYIYPLTDKQINDYILTSSPLDKAGGYGIQDTNYIKAKIIKGNFESIKGLNISSLKKDLEKLNLI